MKVDLNDLVSFKEAATIRDVSVQAIYRLVDRGRLTVFMVGDKRFLSRKEVENFQPDPGGRPKKATKKKSRKTGQKKA